MFTLIMAQSKGLAKVQNFDILSSFENDPFAGHLSTPITTSRITKTYLSLLPAYQEKMSSLLRGINIGFVHGYFLLGPFVDLGPLRNSSVASFIGFISTSSLFILLTTGLVIYGLVSFSKLKKLSKKEFFTAKTWRQFTSGFILGGFSGVSLAYILLNFFGS